MRKEDLYRLCDKGILSHLDLHFAGLVARQAGGDVPELTLAAALVSSRTKEGHICLDLSGVGGKVLMEGENGGGPVICPELKNWCGKLRESNVVGVPGDRRPLILDERARLYLYRYWDYQSKLVDSIRGRVSEYDEDIDFDLLKEMMGRLFAPDSAGEIDWQGVAAFAALVKRFCVISGGPGTGKTTTVARILALLLEEAGAERFRIGLAAPTGKAAARMQETIKGAKEELDCPESVREAIPEEASTIHRLLGSIPGSPYFRHNAKNRLPVDVVVVDEASMVDLALMSKLIQALPSQARLILLGDRDQLASVEAGAVLGDICDTGNVHGFSKRFFRDLEKVTGYRIPEETNGEGESGIRDCVVQLQKNYRFGSDSGIGALSRAVNEGNGDLAVRLLKDGRYSDIKWRELPQHEALAHAVRDRIIQGFGDYLRAGDPLEIFRHFDRFRILCAVRKGPWGVVAMNMLVDQILREERLIDTERRWYAGRPVLITSNDYNLRLFNGDVGIVLPDPGANNDMRAFFPAPDGTARKFHPLRLPEHETVYAMTVHKSQGSEFDNVLLLLPDRESPVLTRELLYTGITRAREGVEVWATESIFRSAISRLIERTSGLRDELWE